MSGFTRRLSMATHSSAIPPVQVGSWEDAVASRDFTQIDAWYAANTGHEAIGYADSDLIDVGGAITSTANGQVIEGRKGTILRIAHNNVTVRGCRITGPGLYGAYYNPTFGSAYTNTLVEYCTFGSVGGDVTNAVLFLSGEGSVTTNLTLRNNNCYGFSQGIRTEGNVLAEYNWMHDFVHPPGEHANSYRHVGSTNGLIRRNYATDGSSGCMSIYFDKEPTANIQYSENILNGSSPLASPSYLINLKDGDYSAAATNIKLINNYFGNQYQYGIFAGTPDLPWGSNGNEFSGNQLFLTGAPYTI